MKQGMARRVWAGTLDLLFPPKCPFCRRILEEPQAPACPECQKKLPWLVGTQGERQVDFADGCFSPLAYQDAVPEAVHRYKFSGVRAYSEPFGLLVAQCMQDHLPEGVDALTWAPLSRKRLRERGYDQAQRLARQAGRTLHLPVFPTLEKVRHTKPQSGLEDEESRKANALGAYRLRPDAAVEGKRLVLVDDVVTSGATLCECARCLKQGGAAKVWCVTLARAGSGKNEKSEKNG